MRFQSRLLLVLLAVTSLALAPTRVRAWGQPPPDPEGQAPVADDSPAGAAQPRNGESGDDAAPAADGEAASTATERQAAQQNGPDIPPPPAPGFAAPSSGRDADHFVAGNLLFVTFHEVGHAMISEFDLPVLGREEDAVDQFATVVLVPDPSLGNDDASVVTDAIAGWFLQANRDGLDQVLWWDQHGPDPQRAYQIACLLYGSAPETYTPLADQIALPPERREGCGDDWQSASRSWSRLIAPHLLHGSPPTQPVTVTYEASGDFAAEEAFLREGQFLEGLANLLHTTFNLPRPIQLTAKICGQPNAFWEPDNARLVMCYELVRDYRQLHPQ